jgi:hypothetical protein
MERMMRAQGGDPRVVEDTGGLLPSAAVSVRILAGGALGLVTGIDPLEDRPRRRPRRRPHPPIRPLRSRRRHRARGRARGDDRRPALLATSTSATGNADAVLATRRATFQIGAESAPRSTPW